MIGLAVGLALTTLLLCSFRAAGLDQTLLQTDCSAFSELYENIEEDLKPWQQSGISEQLTVQTIDRWTNRAREKGFAVAFLDGVAYMIDFE